MHIIIIGAGFAGLSSAKVLKAFGHEVTVLEKDADVGGVWSAARRYPGLTTQNVRSTYCLSDFPFPKEYPEWPSGEQVQAYLASYAKHFRLGALIRLNTEVTQAQLSADGGSWTVKTIDRATGSLNVHKGDYLIVCNGIFSDPMVPDFAGATEFRAAGGRICHSSQPDNYAEVNGQNVLVVGYGKSACDVALAVSAHAATTQVVARQLIWKVPKVLMGVLNFKFLLLTRMGEGLFKYIHLKGFDRFLHGIGEPVRNSMLKQVRWVVARQCKLKQLDLMPSLPFESVARSTVSLVTEGFFEGVATGRITVQKNAEIKKLLVRPEGKFAELSNGQTVPADVVVCGTGWHQRVPFLPQEIMNKVTDEQGNFRLYRSMVPVNVPRLAFNGYNSSLFSQLNCEVGALWIADLLGGGLNLPAADSQNDTISARLIWMEAFTEGKHSKGANLTPFSLHHVDELLDDMAMPLSGWTRFKQWLLPISPSDYSFATQRLLARYKH